MGSFDITHEQGEPGMRMIVDGITTNPESYVRAHSEDVTNQSEIQPKQIAISPKVTFVSLSLV